jgi:hypothetical protein
VLEFASSKRPSLFLKINPLQKKVFIGAASGLSESFYLFLSEDVKSNCLTPPIHQPLNFQYDDTQYDDTQHDDTQHNDAQHNDTQHKGHI